MKKIFIKIILLFFVIVIIATAYFGNIIMNNFKKSEAFLTVIEKIKRNETNIPIVDDQFEVGYLIGGDLNSEVAHFHFKIYTIDKKFVVYADLKKNQSNSWDITDFEATEK
jgi:hypothetical protein